MRWRRSHDTEVIAGLNNPPPEEVVPDSVDHDTRHQGVDPIRKPASQDQAAAPPRRGPGLLTGSLEGRQYRSLDRFRGSVFMVPPDVERFIFAVAIEQGQCSQGSRDGLFNLGLALSIG